MLVVQNNGKEMYKKVCCRCKFIFLLITSIDFVAVFIAVVLHDFLFLFTSISLTRASLVALAKSVYLNFQFSH